MAELKLNAQATWISLSSAITLGAILFSVYSNWHTHLQKEEDLARRLEVIERWAVPIPIGDRWKCLDQERWIAKLQQTNPGLVVPPLQKVCTP